MVFLHEGVNLCIQNFLLVYKWANSNSLANALSHDLGFTAL